MRTTNGTSEAERGYGPPPGPLPTREGETEGRRNPVGAVQGAIDVVQFGGMEVPGWSR